MPSAVSMADASSGKTPKYHIQLMAGGTACLCMLLIVGGILVGIVHGNLKADTLGDFKTGAGLVGVLYVLYKVIAKVLV